MEIYFRELKIEDIPAIKDISKDIWEGDDYIPNVIEEWLQQKECINYGAFKDEEKKILIGFGRIKIMSKDLVWLEGGRVKFSLQHQGIGKMMIKYALEYARQINAKIAQYSTWSKNFGSISLAKKFGFQKKKIMNFLESDIKTLKLINKPSSEVENITAKKSLKIYRNIPNGPGDELCVGWSYIPLKLKYFVNKNWSWIRNSGAILQKIEFKRTHFQEDPKNNEIWMIIYGEPTAVRELLQHIIQIDLQTKNFEKFVVFCHPKITAIIKEIGFSYYDDDPSGVLLFEKHLG